jgi:hypothetical protein
MYRLQVAILSFFIGRDDAEMFLTEMEDLYVQKSQARGFRRAAIWYGFQVVTGFGPILRFWVEQKNLRNIRGSPLMVVLATTALLTVVTSMAAMPLFREYFHRQPAAKSTATSVQRTHKGLPNLILSPARIRQQTMDPTRQPGRIGLRLPCAMIHAIELNLIFPTAHLAKPWGWATHLPMLQSSLLAFRSTISNFRRTPATT